MSTESSFLATRKIIWYIMMVNGDSYLASVSREIIRRDEDPENCRGHAFLQRASALIFQQVGAIWVCLLRATGFLIKPGILTLFENVQFSVLGNLTHCDTRRSTRSGPTSSLIPLV